MIKYRGDYINEGTERLRNVSTISTIRRCDGWKITEEKRPADLRSRMKIQIILPCYRRAFKFLKGIFVSPPASNKSCAQLAYEMRNNDEICASARVRAVRARDIKRPLEKGGSASSNDFIVQWKLQQEPRYAIWIAHHAKIESTR